MKPLFFFMGAIASHADGVQGNGMPDLFQPGLFMTHVILRGCEEIQSGPSCGGTAPSALLRLLPDVPASTRRRASHLASSRSQAVPPWISSQPLSEAKHLRCTNAARGLGAAGAPEILRFAQDKQQLL